MSRPAGSPKPLRHEFLDAPLVAGLDNYTCRNFTRAYLWHPVMADEILACTLLTLHHVNFYLDPVAQARAHLEAGDCGSWHRAWIKRYEAGDLQVDF